MSSDDQRRGGDFPISDTTLDLARDIHEHLVRELSDTQEEFADGIDEFQADYPKRLFGALAIYLGSVDLPREASGPERSRAIIEGLRRIINDPRLLEQITNTPSEELGRLIMGGNSVDTAPKEVDEELLELRRKVEMSGYLERIMVPDARIIQLDYKTTDPIKVRALRRKAIPKGSMITLKLAPENPNTITVAEYEEMDKEYQYTGYIRDRELTVDNLFNLISAESELGVPASLARIIGAPIRIGRVTTGSQLVLKHGFWTEDQVLKGEPSRLQQGTLRLKAKLDQAYAGDSRELALFPYFRR